MSTVGQLRSIEHKVLARLRPRLAERRLVHIRAVNNAYAALVEGRIPELFDALPLELRQETAIDPYCRALAEVRERHQALSARERSELAAAVALHDIGYLVDQGVNHNAEGARLVGGLLTNEGITGVDRQTVSELIKFHGLFMDATAQFLPRDLHHFSEVRKTQLLILGIVDAIGKPDGSILSQRVLNTLIDLREGRYDDPVRYYGLRLRSLLGPTAYSFLESNMEFHSLFEAIAGLATEEHSSLFRNLTGRFRNRCWPVFQELVRLPGGLRSFLTVLNRLSRIADTEFRDKLDIYLDYYPDFFRLSGAQRRPYLDALNQNPRGRYLMTYEGDDAAVIEINMSDLRLAPPGP